MFGLKLLSEPQEPTLEDQLEEARALADSLRSDIEAATNDSAAAKRPISGMHDELRATEGEIERRTFDALRAAGVVSRFDPAESENRNRTFRVEACDIKLAVRTLHDSWFGA